jgi:hypothetical protein
VKLNDLIQRVRAHPELAGHEPTKMPEDNFGHMVAQLVPSVLQDLSESVGMDIGFKRGYTFSDPATTTATLGLDGTVDLVTLTAQNGLLIENLKFGEIRHPDYAFPLIPEGSSFEGALPGNFDKTFGHYWMVGTVIHTRSQDSNATPLTGDLSFACPRVAGLDSLNVQLEDDLTEAIVMRLKGSIQLRETDTPAAGGAQ